MEKSLGKRLKALRELAKISQGDLAKKLGVDRVSLSLAENDKRLLKSNELILLSKTFNLSIDDFLDLETPTKIVLERTQEPINSTNNVVKVSENSLLKFKEVLLYVLENVGAKPNVNEAILSKLLYFIDFNFYEKYKEKLIGATYTKNYDGPFPVELLTILNEMMVSNDIELFKTNQETPLKKFIPLREADLSILTAREIKTIDDVLQRLSNMKSDDLCEYALQDAPCVEMQDRQKIDYDLVFKRSPAYRAH